MSRQVRYRVTALVLGGLLLGVPLLTNGTASADQVEGDRQVVFAGGGDVLGLSCRSQPDVESMTVPAGSTVRVVNRTGHSATLRLGGATKGTIPEDGSGEVIFHGGTTAVLLSPDCALGDEAIPVLVTATPSNPAAMPDPMPAPSGSAGASTEPSETPSASTAGSALPDSVTPATAQHPSTTSAGGPYAAHTSTARPGTSPVAAITVAEAMPQGGSAPRLKTKSLRRTDAAAPAFAGMPPGEHKTIASGVLAAPLSADNQAAPSGAAAPASDLALAEPVAAMEPLPESGPSGLLVLTAIVCVIGVAVGAIRAFVSQRASRTTIA
jgi:hypothetical protein